MMKSILWALVAFLPLVVANAAQGLSLVLAPFSMPLFRRVNFWIAEAVWSWWSFLIERVHGTPIVVEGDALTDGESGVVFANHQCMLDIVVLLSIARRTGRMADMRWMVKDSMRFVPILGWAMLSLDFLFLKRDWSRDRERIQATFERFRQSAQPLLLVLFPEGTRRTPAKHAASVEHARRTGAVATENVMLPRTKGFVASVQGLEGKAAAIYRFTISYPDGAPELGAAFSGRLREVRVGVVRHPIAAVPADEGALGAWLGREFHAMDEFLSRRRTS